MNIITNKELFDKAVLREYRIIQKFFDINEAEVFKERFKEIEYKIFVENSASENDIKEAENIIKRNLKG